MSFYSSAAERGRFIKGKRIYNHKLASCAMWWRRLGDIKKSNGTRLKNNTELYQELGKMSPRKIKMWLGNPQHYYPRVNCRTGHFYTSREVDDLIYFIKRKANNPPKKPLIKRTPFIKSRIKLVKTMKLHRERLKTLKQIRKWLPKYGNSTKTNNRSINHK